VPRIRVLGERDTATGWAFQVSVTGEDGDDRDVAVRLSWADYDLWSRDGSDPPARVAEAVVRFLLERQGPAGLRPAFDAAICRRQFPDADVRIPGLIGG
jgi:hypothetical protein